MDKKILSHFAVLEAGVTCMDILQRQRDYLEKEGHTELVELADKALGAVMDMYQKAGVDMPEEFWGGGK